MILPKTLVCIDFIAERHCYICCAFCNVQTNSNNRHCLTISSPTTTPNLHLSTYIDVTAARNCYESFLSVAEWHNHEVLGADVNVGVDGVNEGVDASGVNVGVDGVEGVGEKERK